MLSNAYFLAKFRFDTAENEPAKNLQNFRKMHFLKMHFSKLHFSKMHQVPQLSWASHEIDIGGLVDRPMKLTMGELVKLPLKTIPVTVQCAGNRRKEQNMIKKGMGFDWGAAAASTNIWTGVLVKDVLEYVGRAALMTGGVVGGWRYDTPFHRNFARLVLCCFEADRCMELFFAGNRNIISEIF